MSVKMMGLVWDLRKDQIEQNEKFVYLAYADHADHLGRNIFPGITLIAHKTGYDERSVQRLTRSLYLKGFLVPDGGQEGGRGVIPHWHMPYDAKGDKLSPIPVRERVTPEGQKGDKPDSDLPVKGDTAMSPDSLTSIEPSTEEDASLIPQMLKQLLTEEPLQVRAVLARIGRYRWEVKNDATLLIHCLDPEAVEYCQAHYARSLQNLTPGFFGKQLAVAFVWDEVNMVDAGGPT